MDFKKSINPIYREFFSKLSCDVLSQDNLEWTVRKGKKSKSSLSFNKPLEELFELSNKDRFGKKGKGADRRISVLHSSALLPLLCFYNITEANPLSIEIDGGKQICFDDVEFEVPNKVFDKAYPSKIDVALISRKDKVVLYLESKFSEYLWGKVSKKIKEQYDDTLKILIENYDTNKRQIEGLIYGDGVKQLIAHFIGICKGGTCDKSVAGGTRDNSVAGLIRDEGYEVYLGEICFKFDKWENRLCDYSKQYSELAKKMNDLLTRENNRDNAGTDEDIKDVNRIIKHAPEKFSVLKNLLVYQDLISKNPQYKIDEKVRLLYQFQV